MITKTCVRDGCGVVFSSKDNKKKYCSRTCAAIVNNTGRRRHPLRYCVCGEILKQHRKTCDNCRRNATEKWLAGELSPSYRNGELKKFVKVYLINQSNGKCSRCGWGEINPVLGYAILTIDHIDGNWKNNLIDNLVVLCYNCHSLTPTFGRLNTAAKNRKRGRRDYDVVVA